LLKTGVQLHEAQIRQEEGKGLINRVDKRRLTVTDDALGSSNSKCVATDGRRQGGKKFRLSGGGERSGNVQRIMDAKQIGPLEKGGRESHQQE